MKPDELKQRAKDLSNFPRLKESERRKESIRELYRQLQLEAVDFLVKNPNSISMPLSHVWIDNITLYYPEIKEELENEGYRFGTLKYGSISDNIFLNKRYSIIWG